MTAVTALGRLLLRLLRELADEAAYARHLSHRRTAATAARRRRFSDERLRVKYGRPKCC